jgi:hypothetical protein
VSDLVEFLRARLDEDEATAHAANTDDARTPYGDRRMAPVPPRGWGVLVEGYLGGPIGEHCARHHPTRVLAEVKAKHARLARHAPEWREGRNADGDEREGWWCSHCDDPFPCIDLRLDAAVYADHPDYRREWKP